MSLGLLIVIVPALVSIAFIFGGIGAFRHQQRVLATWIRTAGTVVDLHEESATIPRPARRRSTRGAPGPRRPGTSCSAWCSLA
jgi:hypothetical protein